MSKDEHALRVILNDLAEEYIDTMEWSDSATDYMKTLVVGNVRGFARYAVSKLQVRLKEL